MEIAKMTILKQCVLFNDQKSRVSMYRLAEYIPELIITDYISCTADLSLVIFNLPSSQYLKMFDMFSTNVWTE